MNGENTEQLPEQPANDEEVRASFESRLRNLFEPWLRAWLRSGGLAASRKRNPRIFD